MDQIIVVSHNAKVFKAPQNDRGLKGQNKHAFTLNTEIPLAAQISIHALGWDCETVRAMKQSKYSRDPL